MLFYVPRSEKWFRYYLRENGGDPSRLDSMRMVPYQAWVRFSLASETLNSRDVNGFIPKGYERVWLVQARVRSRNSENIQAIVAGLENDYSYFTKWDFDGPNLTLFSENPVFDLVLEDFEDLNAVKIFHGGSAVVRSESVSGIQGLGYQLSYSDGGWWNIKQSVRGIDLGGYKGVTLALKGTGNVRVQLRESGKTDEPAERWHSDIKLTDEWEITHLPWSKFVSESSGSVAVQSIDLALVNAIYLVRGRTREGVVAIDNLKLTPDKYE
jgi:hypothetical protein